MICEYCGESRSPIQFHKVWYAKPDKKGIPRITGKTGNPCYHCLGWNKKREYEEK